MEKRFLVEEDARCVDHVEDGRYFMDKQIEVEVTSALQTDAGRMIFARPLHSQRGIDEHTDHKENRNNKDKKK